jgi:hypothetical protein
MSELADLRAEVTALRAQVAWLTDRQQILEVYRRYMRGFDRNDVELLRSAFWPDVQINYGEQVNTFEEFVARHLDLHTSGFAHYAHLLTNESIDVVGDTAHVESYVTALFSRKDETSQLVGGRYIDRLDRRDDVWRIAVREFMPHFAADIPNSLDTAWPHWGHGTWDRDDVSYRRPLERRPA